MCQEIRIQALYSNEIETSGLPLHDAEKAHSEEVRFNVNRQCQTTDTCTLCSVQFARNMPDKKHS